MTETVNAETQTSDTTMTQSTTDCTNTDVPQNECEALVALYNSTDGANWTNNTNWNQTQAVCAWRGVTCDQSPSITELILSNNGLRGSIPTELGNLTNLIILKLSDNGLSRNIPPELGGLNDLLTLDLSFNMLSGSIPSELGSLTNLKVLRLHSNELTGHIPVQLGELDNLLILDLYFNILDGSIPLELTYLTDLHVLNLSFNILSGHIPSELGRLVLLRDLGLSGNRLTGHIPSELGNLTNLFSLDLAFNELSGTIPLELGNLTELMFVSLSDNELNGAIPPELGNLTHLEYLDLSLNALSGSIPPELGNLINLRYFALRMNSLSGSIPPELGNLANLKHLYLNGNMLTGSIPLSIGNLSAAVDLNYNMLSGGWNWTSYANTQTVLPRQIGVEATASANNIFNKVSVSWEPIAYTGGRGYYEVGYSTTPDGPYIVAGQTTGKRTAELLVDELTPGQTYYFAVRTHTSAYFRNQNDLTTAWSGQFSITLPGPPTITSDPPESAEFGKPYNHTLIAIGDTPIQYTVSSGELPPGIVLDGDTISGVPTALGSYSGLITATNSIGAGTQAFDIIVFGEAPIRTYPVDGQTVTAANSGDWQRFQFEHIDGAEWYGVWVGNDTTTGIYQWFPATATSSGITSETPICDTSTMVCTLPVDVWLADGQYSWWMTYWGPNFPAWNSYWNGTTFSVDFAAPSAGALTGVTPSGTVNTAPTEVTWDRDPNVLWMEIWLGQVVGPDGNPYTAFYGWVDATEVCDATTCTLALDASVLPIPDGDYEMWMRLWGPGGFLGWTDVNSNSPAATFTVDTSGS